MSLETLGLFVLTEMLLSLSPGPAVILVLGLALRRGFRIGVAASFGVIAANAVYFALSALGIGALILASATLFTLIKWVGAAYLVWLGLGLLKPLAFRLAGRAPAAAPGLMTEARHAAGAAGAATRGFRRAFLQGFMLQMSNPKNIAFFVAILPQFITPQGNVAGQLVILGIASVTIELPILVAYSLAASKSAALMKDRVIAWIEAAAGGILIALGSALALYRRTG